MNRDSVCPADNCKNYHELCAEESRPQNLSGFAIYVHPCVYISIHINTHFGISVSNCEDKKEACYIRVTNHHIQKC